MNKTSQHFGEKGKVKKHKITKCERVQRRNLRSEHPRTKCKSGGGPIGSFPKLESQEAMMGRCKYRHVGPRKQLRGEKQLPFGQNTMKEDKDKAQNIEGHSREVGQHARTSGI